jgi:parallel beta-helix repeat protein
MSFRNWLRVLNKRSSKSRRRSAAGRRYRSCPALEQLEVRIQPSEYTVTSLGDGPGVLTGFQDFQDTTLRGAINAANTDPAPTVDIFFDASVYDPPNSIFLSGSLPPLTITRDHVNVFGLTANFPGFNNDARLDGSFAGASATGLVITGADCHIFGLSIKNFGGTGIDFSGPGAKNDSILAAGIDNNGTGVLIEGGATDNIVGSDSAAPNSNVEENEDHPKIQNNIFGIEITGAETSGNVVEGTDIGETSGNFGRSREGVILSDGAFGNTIGGQATSSSDMPHGSFIQGNSDTGVLVITGAHDNIIGGPAAGRGNHISDNRLAGVWMLASDNNIVEGNLILSDDTGVIIGGGSSNNTVGGSLPNHIFGNELAGILIYNGATNNQIHGNTIGTTDPIQFLGNGTGVLIQDGAIDNTVGGTAPGAGNLIVDNTGPGIAIEGNGTSGNKVQGNRIGGVNGSVPLPNDTGMVISDGASENTIGGTAAGAGNVISANSHDGIDIQGSGTIEDVVERNIIGADSSGQNSLPNGGDGVRIDTGASLNTVGGGEGSGNLIAFNKGAGVDVRDSTSIRNAIQLNSIFDNQALGIDLGGDGVTQNTTGGPHTGPNNLQNFPTILSVDSGTVTFVLDSGANNDYTIDFYANAMPDPSGFGQGRTYLGSMDVFDVNVPYTFHYTPVPGELFITATATDFGGNTSEFSGAVAPHNIHSSGGLLRIPVEDQQAFRMARDPIFPQLLDLGFDRDTVSIDPSVFSQIEVTGAADSTIDIEDVPAGLPVTISGATGNQIVNISPSAQNLGQIQSPVSVYAGESALTLNIYDQGDPLVDVYTLTDSGFSDKQSAGISYDGVSAVNLIGSSLPDTYNILNTASSATTALYSNNGNDVVNVEATTGPLTVNLPASGNPTVNVSPTAQNLDTILGSLIVAGQGVGTLVLDDQGGTAGRNYTLTSTNLGWGGPALVAFGDLGALTLNATTFNDSVTVQSLPAFAVALDGGKGSNTLVGPDTANTWMLATPSGTEGTLNSLVTFNSFSELTGGQGTDRFVVPDGAYIPEILSGGDGFNGGSNNTLDLSAYTSPLMVHIFSSVYGGTVAGVVRAFALCQNVIGGHGDDHFLFDQGFGLTGVDGGPGNNTLDFSPYSSTPPGWGFDILGHNSGLVAGAIGAFRNIQNLIGTQTNDPFAFRGTAYLDGTIDGGGGSNSLFYTQSAASVSVNLQTGTASYVNYQGGSAPQPGGITNIQSFVGGPGSSNTLIGPNTPSTWTLTGATSGTVNAFIFSGFQDLTGGMAANTLIGTNTPNTWTITGPNSGTVNAFTFSAFQSLTGGAAADTFVFQPGGSIAASVDGGGGTNTLDYSHYTGNITVDLALNQGSLVNQGATGSVFHIARVIGSIGSDLLVGDANPTVLIGGTGRNILIADMGGASIYGGGGDNIQIGGYTSYDQNLTALDAILAEWTSADSLSTRRRDLRDGGGLNGTYILNPTATRNRAATVFDNGEADQLYDGTGLSWFFLHQPDDQINNGAGPLLTSDLVTVIH